MVTVKKNQIIVVALLIVIAIAGYISYLDNTELEYSQQYQDVVEEVSLDTNVVEEASLDSNSAEEETSLGDAIFTTNMEENSETKTKDETEESNAKETEESNVEETINEVDSNNDYFMVEKLMRDKEYQEKISQKTALIKDESVKEEEKKEIISVMNTMDSNYQKVTEIERLLRGKGFSETLVTFGSDGNVNVDVEVKGEKLTKKDIAKIKSVVVMQTGTTEDKIVINPIEQP